MDTQNVLFAIAEVSIGLAGFSGLVAAFSQRQGQAWRGDQKTRIVFLVVLSFGMIVTSLMPPALSEWSNAPSMIWGIPMTTYSILALGLLAYWVTVSRRQGYKIQFPKASYPILLLATVLQVTVLLSGLGIFLPYSSGLFVLGFLAILIFGANVFLALLNTIWEQGDNET